MNKWLLLIVSLLCMATMVGQSNIVQEGSHKVIIEQDTINAREYNTAIELLLNAQLQGKQARIIMAPVRVDLDMSKLPVATDTIIIVERDTVQLPPIIEAPQPAVDTIIATECFEDYNKKIWLNTGAYPNYVWIPFKETGLSIVYVDSLPIWKKKYQDKWKLERIKDFANAQTSYRELDIPFQFFVKDSIVSISDTVAKVRVFGSEDWYPEVIVNGVSRGANPEFTPGFQDFDGYETRRHSITIDGLAPSTTYNIVIKGYCREDEGEIDQATFEITTTP